MDSRNISRRALLLTTALSLPVLQGRFGAMQAAEASALAAPDLASYRPAFFSEPEWSFVQAFCDRLIPADEEGPGALQANVPIFIDHELSGAYGRAEDWYMEGPFDPKAPAAMGFQLSFGPAEIYRRGIRATDAWCRRTHGGAFAALDPATLDAVLGDLERDRVDFAAEGEELVAASAFFGFLLTNTQEGYLSDPMYGGNKGMEAWRMIGFPGARASFLEWIGQHDVPYPLGPVSLLGQR